MAVAGAQQDTNPKTTIVTVLVILASFLDM